MTGFDLITDALKRKYRSRSDTCTHTATDSAFWPPGTGRLAIVEATKPIHCAWCGGGPIKNMSCTKCGGPEE